MPQRISAFNPTATPEFDLIARYFTPQHAPHVRLGVGDDCALIDPTPGKSLAVSTDTLVAGVHFFHDVDASALGHKALAVNLSDLAAMGATPRAFTLALTLPEVNDPWLAGFSAGLMALAEAHDCALIGGDTTRGPLSITITVLGEVDAGRALRRDAARVDDDIWVSGSLGGAALALKHLKGEVALAPSVAPRAVARLTHPEPRVALGLTLTEMARAAIDISDGLVADLTHIATCSGLDAEILWEAVPLHPALLAVSPVERQACALAGGDDYELCFTAPVAARETIHAVAERMSLALTRVGRMVASVSPQAVTRVRVLDKSGDEIRLTHMGFDHFASSPK